ncbi:MAG TPA: hypothetical protein PKL29_04925 [Methanothrix sp.]|nr:hypothetical protein [Methanothrix sp.]
MVLSAFASFVLRGTDQSEISVEQSSSDSLKAFGMQGNLVDWNFDGISDVLEMAPESTVMAYWVNLSASQNLTNALKTALPESLGLRYGSQLYSTNIERLAGAEFNGTWTEFHWIKPYQINYNSLVIPYENYMMIPTGTDYVTVLGRPVLFGSQDGVQQVIDVITGGEPANGFTLDDNDTADLQVVALGSGGSGMPLSGVYRQFSLDMLVDNESAGSYSLQARLVQPAGNATERIADIATKNNLSYSSQGSDLEISGHVADENLQNVLMALLGP